MSNGIAILLVIGVAAVAITASPQFRKKEDARAMLESNALEYMKAMMGDQSPKVKTFAPAKSGSFRPFRMGKRGSYDALLDNLRQLVNAEKKEKREDNFW